MFRDRFHPLCIAILTNVFKCCDLPTHEYAPVPPGAGGCLGRMAIADAWMIHVICLRDWLMKKVAAAAEEEKEEEKAAEIRGLASCMLLWKFA